MNYYKRTLIAISTLYLFSAYSMSLSATRVEQDFNKPAFESVKGKVKEKLSVYYMNTDNDSEFEKSLNMTETQTDLVPIGLPDKSRCISISENEEKCPVPYLNLRMSQEISSIGLKGSSSIAAVETEVWDIFSKSLTAPTPPAPEPPVSDMYSMSGDGITSGSKSEVVPILGPNGGAITETGSVVSSSGDKISKKFPVFGCFVGNSSMHFYNSENELIGTVSGKNSSQKMQSTESTGKIDRNDISALTSLPYTDTYGYKISIPYYFDFRASFGEIVYELDPSVYMEQLPVKSSDLTDDFKYTVVIDIYYSDEGALSSEIYNYPSDHSIWNTVCHK